MPDHHTISVHGKITHVFGHRFVVETSKGAVLADITPKGLEQHQLRIGEQVELSGEMKPSELKVSRLTSGKTTIEIAHKKPHDDHPHAEPGDAIKAARKAGIPFAGVTWGFNSKETLALENPDHLIDTPAEFLRLAGH